MRSSKLSALLSIFAVIGLSCSSVSQAATAQDYTFTFLGICQDCGLQPDDSYGIGEATATLSVTNYILGESLAGHITDFVYISDLLGQVDLWTHMGIPEPAINPHIYDISGSIDSLSQTNPIMSFGFDSQSEHQFQFNTDAQGNWGIAPAYHPVADFGYSYTMTGALTNPVPVQSVPEPETYAMLLAGLGLLVFSARRRGQNGTMTYA